MNVLIIGSGAREHAFAWLAHRSPRLSKLFCIPGNAGTAELGTNVPLNPLDGKTIARFAKAEGIDLAFVTPDNPLAAGVVDVLRKNKIPAWGPVKRAALMESSKIAAAQKLAYWGVPTPDFTAAYSFNEALGVVRKRGVPIVIKADGLALGKGVKVVRTLEEAEQVLHSFMIEKTLGSAGTAVLIQEYVEGTEISVHAFCDGENFELFPFSHDYKLLNGEQTGGMGTVAPVPGLPDALAHEVSSRIVAPIVSGMQRELKPFVGCLYPGLMLTDRGPLVLEVNVRPGDPEFPAYARLLATDILEIAMNCTTGSLYHSQVSWMSRFVANVVIAAPGYPGTPVKGLRISGIESAESIPGVKVFHGGTKRMPDGELTTAGGRVLEVTAIADTLEEAVSRANIACNSIDINGMQLRDDIGLDLLKA